MKHDEPFLLTLGIHGLNEWLSISDGRGFYFELEENDGKKWKRVLPNIWQPNPKPSVNLHHIDEFSVRDDVFIRHFSAQLFIIPCRKDLNSVYCCKMEIACLLKSLLYIR